MSALFVEEAVDEVAFSRPYAATLALSGSGVGLNPSGTANEMEIFERETFGGGHTGNVQEEPVRETEVPSGQSNAPTGQTIGCAGCSTAFRYTNPPIPTTRMSKIPSNKLFIR